LRFGIPVTVPNVERHRPQLPWLEIGLTLLGIAFLAGVVLLVPELRHAFEAAIQGDTDEVRNQINTLGWGGHLLILALTIIHTVVPYPAEIVNAAAGFAYGFWEALLLVTIGWMASALLAYAFGARVARPLLERWFGAERFDRVEQMIERGGVTLLLAIRLIPIVPFSLACYAAGAARVPLWRFFWTTLVGYLPITMLAVYFGTRLEGISLTDPIVAGSAVALIILLVLGNWIVRRQARREKDAGVAIVGEDEPSGAGAEPETPAEVSGGEAP
jgi:uncharacterized membrane protein YdjX (TVP38/TMEM64 family)